MKNYDKQYQGRLLLTIVLGLNTAASAFSSKWTQIDSLARALCQNDVASRLHAKEQMLAVLMAEDPDYPVYYVKQNAEGADNGMSWDDAFTDIQPAIEAAAQSEGWVWVARGDYTGTYPYGDGAIRIKQGVMLFGGFAGHETHLNERNPEHNITIIRGWNGRRAVDMLHQTLIDGFTIKDSGYRNISGALSTEVAGGGIRTRSWLSVIRNNVITGNWAKSGGGIAAWNRENSGTENVPGYVPVIDRNIITGNQGSCGAGVNIRGTEALFCHNIVYKNHHEDLSKSKGIEVHIRTDHSKAPMIVNSIVYGHRTGQFNDIYNHVQMVDTYGGGAKAKCYYNCVENGGYGVGLVTADPQFVNADEDDFHLSSTSPCLNAGHPDGPTDEDGSRADIGFHPPLQYLLTLDLNGVPAASAGAGWHAAGSQVHIHVDTLLLHPTDQTAHHFLRWEGQGSGSYTGADPNPIVLINNEMTQTAFWQTRHYVTIQTGTSIDSLSGWYADGESLTLNTSGILPISPSIRHLFQHWTIEADSGSHTVDDTTLTLTIDAPLTLSMHTNPQFWVQVITPYGNAAGQGWYDENSIAAIQLDSATVPAGSGHRHLFQTWQGEGLNAFTGSDTAFTLQVQEPVIQTAVWQEQFRVDIDSDFGQFEGAGWYNTGSLAMLSTDSLISISEVSRQQLRFWTVNTNDTLGTRRFQWQVNAPVSAQTHWQKAFWIDLTVSPADKGRLSPIEPPGAWQAQGDTLVLLATGHVEGYGFVEWQGIPNAFSNPAILPIDTSKTLTARFDTGNVTLNTRPPGLSLTADSIVYTSPCTFYWHPGIQHEIDVIPVQENGAGLRYQFSAWSDQGAQQHLIEGSDHPMTYTASFDTLYQLDIQNGGSSVSGDGWYLKNETASVTMDSITADSAGIRHRFSHWQIISDDTTRQSRCGIQIPMTRPVILSAQWQKQIRLQTAVEPSFSGHLLRQPDLTWYDAGQTVRFEAVPVDTFFTFHYWKSQTALDSAANPLIQSFDAPDSLIAVMVTESAFPPQISGLADCTLLEDNNLIYSLSDLDNHIQDENDAVTDLNFYLSAAHFSMDWNRQQLQIIPQAHWSGTDNLILTVTDGLGFSDSDTFSVTVYPVPDPPMPFDLIEPASHLLLADTTSHLLFQWQKSINVDLNDVIQYTLHFSSDSSFAASQYQWPCGSDTLISIQLPEMDGVVYWRILASDAQGLTAYSRQTHQLSFPTAVEQTSPLPDQLTIFQNYPNPFNASTRIDYALPESGEVTLKIYDIQGQLVQEYNQHHSQPGQYEFYWHGEDQKGHAVASGIYLIQIKMNNQFQYRKMNLIR